MIYLDNAATTWPKPEAVYVEMDSFFRNYGANPGRAGHKMAAHAGRKVYEVREAVAEFFGAQDSSEIIFTTSTTHSLNLGIKGVVKVGDHIITSSLEHNSVIRPLKELEKEGVIELSIVELDESGDLDLEMLKKSIKVETKMIVVSHGSNVTGHLFDLKKIGQVAKDNKVLFMVDAAQTAGVFSINLSELNVDLMAFAGHKSLYGPPGTGGLFIRKGTEVKPIFAGGTGSKSEELYQPEVWPEKYESGTANSIGIAGLGEGIKFIKNEGLDKIRAHEMSLCQSFMNGLVEIENVKIYGPGVEKPRTPVVSFNIGEESSSEVGYILDQVFDIAVRSGLHCAPLTHQTIGTLQQGVVRASFGYFNTQTEINQAVIAIRQIADKVS